MNMLTLLRSYSWQELRQHPWRHAAAVVAVMLGVALAFAVQLINASALSEFSQAVRTVNGQADLALRAPQGALDEALYTRVREAMNARGAARDAMIASDPFLRNDRSARAWLDGLRKLFEPVGGLRSSAHTEESAWRVVSDSAAEEEARIGAAAALANNSDERSKERLRAVAANVASTRVRVAIEAAAKGDEEALVESMEALAKEGAERATKK